VRVPPGPVQRSERGLPPPRRGTSSSPRRPKALSAGRPAAPTLPDRPSKPQCDTGTTGGRAVSARCWILRLHNVYRYKLLIRGDASFREGRGRPPRALLAERPQPLIWTFPQGSTEPVAAKARGLAAPASARRSPLSPIGPRERARSGPGKEGGLAGSRAFARAASMTSRRAAAPLSPGCTDEVPPPRATLARPAPGGGRFAGISTSPRRAFLGRRRREGGPRNGPADRRHGSTLLLQHKEPSSGIQASLTATKREVLFLGRSRRRGGRRLVQDRRRTHGGPVSPPKEDTLLLLLLLLLPPQESGVAGAGCRRRGRCEAPHLGGTGPRLHARGRGRGCRTRPRPTGTLRLASSSPA